MTSFEFVFSLFGLLLGLSLAEVLGGFGRAVQKRRKLRLGWLTPFLASAAALVLAKGKRANLALLVFMALQYPVGAWLQMIGW